MTGYAASQRKVPLVFEVRDLWPEMPIAMGALQSPWLGDKPLLIYAGTFGRVNSANKFFDMLAAA